MDLQERVSYIQSATKDKDVDGDYADAKTPGELEDGALVAGGALSLVSREALALFSQYFAIGILYGMLPGMQYSVFQNYLKMEGYQVSAYGVLVVLGWSFKVFFGMLSDCVPIMGYRRKPWMILGWTIATVCLCIMTFSSFPDPYCDAREIPCPKKVPTGVNMTPELRQWYNFDAPDQGGKFVMLSVIVSFGYVMADCAADAMVVHTLFFLVEVKTERTPFGAYISNFWGLLQKRVMWQICAFKFINQVFAGISATPGSPMASVWAEVEPLNDALSGVLSYLIMTLVMAAVGKWGLHWNWRWVIALGTIGIILIDGIVIFVTIWDVFRNQWFFTGVPLADNVPAGIRFIVATYCAVEIADIGNEGATYGLVTTISNLASPFASVIYKLIDSYFDVSMDQMAVDDKHVRWEVSYCYFISYGCKLAALGWLFLLPPQKEAMQELKKRGQTSKLAGALLVAIFFIALIFSVTTNFMSVYPSTKCYRIAGGKGTVNGSCPVKK
ncbi:hypothetical protein SPRG_20045 [Saprolegnia parasitica CBS 223.65]|uniref:Major facilitator superfamily associated domain-containing protein n=1 Tax=Saprolegnia parasitica (strain CBS 223.65) TaxID=695850 RepID=A0A067CQS3_SAPPC|nr:hypothetical protein SPRG_20045 [Saprolegnia parasitica CBS 223.65]KDO28881.1 hypothetical protein SPRG_20045 [Saprolegnia parasitica CBS 223.65]|eukprot:XP_012200573.1 hypothetical protein SPRG_20045 [Saprolegnia parasitica CBS 223.65]